MYEKCFKNEFQLKIVHNFSKFCFLLPFVKIGIHPLDLYDYKKSNEDDSLLFCIEIIFRLFHFVDDGCKSIRIVHGKVSQNFAVDINVVLLQFVNKY